MWVCEHMLESTCETLFSVFHMYLVTLQADGRKCQNGTHYTGDIKNKPLGSKCQRALHQNNTQMCSSEMSSWWANTWNKKMSFALTDVFMKPLMGKSRFSTRFSFNRALRSALHEEMIKMWPEDLRSLTVGADYLSNITILQLLLHIVRLKQNSVNHSAY